MDNLRKYSRHLIGWSIFFFGFGFYFLVNDNWIGMSLIPLSLILITFGITGWISKPKSKINEEDYASMTDYYLGYMWEKIIPQFWTAILLLTIIIVGVLAYRKISIRSEKSIEDIEKTKKLAIWNQILSQLNSSKELSELFGNNLEFDTLYVHPKETSRNKELELTVIGSDSLGIIILDISENNELIKINVRNAE